MSVVLWITASVLAVVLLVSGAAKLALPRDRIVSLPAGAFAADFSPAMLRFVGTLEVVAAVGLTMPAIVDVASVLVPVTAVCVVVLMIGAARVHLRRSEIKLAFGPAFYGAVAALLAVARFGPYPVAG